MKIYWIFRQHYKTVKVIHLGFDISCCIENFHAVISISILFITIGVSVYKKANNL